MNVDIDFCYDTIKNEDVNPLYLDRYKNFLKYCQTSDKEDYTELHHILPKSIYKELSKDDRNLIRLNAREHYIAHWILAKIFNCRKKYSVIKAFHRMTISSKKHGNCRYNSKLYRYNKKLHSLSMKENNPMLCEEVRENAGLGIKKAWENEDFRRTQTEKRIGVDNISPEGKKRLSELWMGVKRPKTEEQVYKIISASSKGDFITPFGTFPSPGFASRQRENVKKYSRHTINRLCKNNLDGFSYVPKEGATKEKRGKWKRDD
jgi:hypothetical protein